MASSTWTDSLRSIPDSISASFLPDFEHISSTTMDRGTNKFMSSFLDELKVFEPRDASKVVHVTAKCFRSMRKTADPHTLSINIDVDKITDAYCSCKAGLGGHCSHIIGLLKTLQYFKLQSFSSIPDRLSCTSMPQAWGAQSARGLRIEPVPINHLTLARHVTHRKRRPKECSVDLNKIVTKAEPEEIAALKLLHGTPLTYMLTPSAPTVSTPLGEVQIGSAVSYQVLHPTAKYVMVADQV